MSKFSRFFFLHFFCLTLLCCCEAVLAQTPKPTPTPDETGGGQIKTFEVRLRVDNKDRRLAVGMTAYVLMPTP